MAVQGVQGVRPKPAELHLTEHRLDDAPDVALMRRAAPGFPRKKSPRTLHYL
jgi:hypothetical protein